MSMGIGSFTANFTMTARTMVQKSQTAVDASGAPVWDPGKVWGSLGDMDNGFRSYSQEWNKYYSQSFATAGAGSNGTLTRDELDDLLRSEFGGMGVTFVDRKPGEPKTGRHEVYIDDVNRQKMADDPAYRAKMMSVIQMEMAGVTGYAFRDGNGVVTNRLSGTVLSMAEGDPLYEGVPHSGGAVSAGGGVRVDATTSAGEAEGKWLMTLIIEKMQEMMEERQARREQENLGERQAVTVDISVEARAWRGDRDGSAATTAEARENDSKTTETHSLLDVLA